MNANWKTMIQSYQETILYSSGILVKLFLLHRFIGIEESLVSITIKNYMLFLALFCLICLFQHHRRITLFLSVNLLTSVILFIDVVYYSHFYTLIPVSSVFQIGQIGGVSASIFALLKPLYALLFIDIIVLAVYSYKKRMLIVDKEPSIKKWRQKKYAVTLIMLLLIVSVMTLGVFKKTEGNYTPYNLGMINYHVYDFVSFFVKISLDEERAETIMPVLTEEPLRKKGANLAQGYNVIVIQAESLQSFVLNKKIDGQEITPILNALLNNDSLYFSQFYEQVGWGNTSDAEFVSHNSYYPSSRLFSYKAYEENDFITLPHLLKEEGYQTLVFHGNTADFWTRGTIYPSQGIDRYVSIEELKTDEIIGMGLSDGSLFHQSIDFLKETPQPFYAFYITLTSHHPFIMDEKYQNMGIPEQYDGTILEHYLHSIHYMDREIGNFLTYLKNEGLYENTMFVILGDHQGLDMRNEEINAMVSQFIGKEYKEDEMLRVPLIVHKKGLHEKEYFASPEIKMAGGQIDFLPTIGNLVGLDLHPDQYIGKDLLNAEHGFAAIQIHVARGSFVDDEKIFVMANDGVFDNSRAWDLRTGSEILTEFCREGYDRAMAEINLSEYIMENNLVSVVMEKGLSWVIENR